jgi:hypothetical protein
MDTIRWSVWAAIFLILSCSSFAAMDHYPRIWENETWIEENPNTGYFWILLMGNMGEQEEWEDFLNRDIPTFQDGLEEMRLGELREGRGYGDPLLEEAFIYGGWASEISRGGLIANPKQSWDMWSYPGNWMNCINYSLGYLEGLGTQLNGKRNEFKSEQAKFYLGGACDSDYVGYGQEYCTPVAPDASCDYSGMFEWIPEFDWYYGCVQEHYDAIDQTDAMIAEINWSYHAVELLCEETAGEAATKKEAVITRMGEFGDAELDHIYKSASGEGGSEAEGLGRAYEELVEMQEMADDAQVSAAFGQKNAGKNQWMKKCIMDGAVAIAAYDAILDSDILEEAEAIVEERGEGAHLALSEAEAMKDQMGILAKGELELARTACKNGDAVDTALGIRFEEYSKCILYSQIAMESASGGEDVVAAYRGKDVERVQDLINRAKIDGIDVFNEERLLAGVNAINDPGYLEVLENIEESVLAKAEAKYGYLPKKREELKWWVSLSENVISNLDTWFEHEACYGADGELDYLCALGSLKEMSKAYWDIENEILQNKDAVVQGALYVEYGERVGVVQVDEAGEAYLYVDISNPLPFSGEDVVVEISTDLDFRKIDIVEGSEDVTVVMDKGSKGIELHISEIGALEGKEIVFKKEEIICRTKAYEETAYGDTTGGASVLQEMKINCAYPVEGLILADGIEEGKISLNGMEIGKNSLGRIDRELPAGTHEITVESYDYGAYNVDREVSFVSTVGLDTNVELFFIFHPNRDLEYVTFSSVEEGKDLDSLSIFGYTGERIQDKKIIGGNTIFFKVNGLIEGRDARVRVSYEISSLEEFVDNAILEYSYGQDLTDSEGGLLEEAKMAAFEGQYEEAYKTLEKLRGLVEKREKQHMGAIEKHEKIKEKIQERISTLEEALAIADGLGLENSYVNEMEARLEELRDALETEVADDALVGPLESFDLGWEKKELTKISKELLSQETDLKEEWVDLGTESAEMEGIVSDIESKNSEFGGSLDFGDAMGAFSLLEEGRGVLEQVNEENEISDAAQKEELDGKIEDAYGVWEGYNREYAIADGTHLESFFPKTPKEISKELEELSETEEYSSGVEDADGLVEEMEETLELLREEGIRLEESVVSLYSASEDGMGEGDSEFVLREIEDARAYRASGDYALSIQSLERAMDRIENFEGEDNGILVLAITGLLILGVIGLYLARDNIPKDILPQIAGKKKPKREYRTLKREIQ